MRGDSGMSVAITIQLSPQAIALTQKYKNASTQVPQAIQRGMTRALQIVAGRIQVRRLTGKGPFPVEQHRLGERSGQLKLRTRSTPAKITTTGDTSTIEGAIGSSAYYAAFQEYGTKTLPERAPFRTGIKENAKYISDEIGKEIEKTLKP